MDKFLRDAVKDGYQDSKKDRDKFMTKEESAQAGIAQLLLLVILILVSLLPFVTFQNVILFLVLVELVAIKDTLRKGLTRVE